MSDANNLGRVPQTMKALVKTKEGAGFDFATVPIPEPKGDEVLIRVEAVTICGSDISLYRWNNVARVIATIPFTPGHECAGTVIKCGPGADLPIGSKVAVENHFYCGNCYQCTHDEREICANMGQFGHGRKTQHGGCSQFTIVSAKYLYVLTRNLNPQQTALMEPLGVAHNAIERLDVAGEDVLVIGCGAVGLFAQTVARALGAKTIIATDVKGSRFEIAKKMGADIFVNSKDRNLKEVIMAHTHGVGMGRICECSGASSMVNSCFSLLRKGGRVSLVGLPREPLHVENVLQDIVFKALTIKTVHGRRIFHTWREVERLVADGKVNTDDIISHQFPMSEFEDAFKMFTSGKGCKIVIDPWR